MNPGLSTDEPEEKETSPSEPSNPYSEHIEPKEKRAERRRKVSDPTPEVVWKTIENGTRNEGELEDRAAEYLPGKDVLVINGDFGVHRFAFPTPEIKRIRRPSERKAIQYYVNREYKFTLIEATMKTKLLNDNPNWSRSEIEEKSLSPEGLTAAVMSSYHLHYMLHQNIGRWLSAVERGGDDLKKKKKIALQSKLQFRWSSKIAFVAQGTIPSPSMASGQQFVKSWPNYFPNECVSSPSLRKHRDQLYSSRISALVNVL